jgi:alpha-N-arabinofuranosidase
MHKAKLVLDRDYVIADIDPRLYGSFIEHLGRAVYTGIYQPGHPAADSEGFRQDVLDLVRKLDVPVTRYPGGNFVSGYDWRDGIGPKDQRPQRLDLAWKTTETNQVGLHEFVSWAQKANTQVMYAVNLGTGTPADARDIVEYANHPGGTQLSDLRRSNGARNPFDIKLWCLGNEMDGAWQMGTKTAYEYGRVATEAAKLMKWVDPSIELVACGSSGLGMSTFGEWEYQVLSECYDHVDYVSLHTYYGNRHNDTNDFLASTMDLDQFIKTVVAVCDAVRGKKRAKKRIQLSFDEWNVWYHSNQQDEQLYRRQPWGTALPLLEDIYTFEDALLVGLMLITFLKNADRVRIACMAQLVNVIAPIMTNPEGGAWAQTIYYPLMQASRWGRGRSLQPILTCDTHDTARHEAVPLVDAAAVLNDDGGLTIFAVNRDLVQSAELTLDLRSFDGLTLVEHQALTHEDVKAVNTEQHPDNVVPHAIPPMQGAAVVLPKASWNVLRYRKQ